MKTPEIWSLSDIMRAFFLFHYVFLMDTLRKFEAGARNDSILDSTAMLNPTDHANVMIMAIDLRKILFECDLLSGLKRFDGPFARAMSGAISCHDAHIELKVFREAIEGDLVDRYFVVIPAAKSRITIEDSATWGQLDGKFTITSYDVEEALFCYALGRNTASVFHSMRIAELGLRALAKRMKVRLPKGKRIEWAQWQQILSEMDKKCDAIARTMRAGPHKDELLEFYRGAVGQFYGFKDEYRNHVMHVRKTYDEFQAGSILIRVRDFMLKLASVIDEKGMAVKNEEKK